MPNAVVKSFAEKAGKSVSAVEDIWNETKASASKKFPKKGPHFWAYVNKTVQKKLGISEHLTLRDFITITEQDLPTTTS